MTDGTVQCPKCSFATKVTRDSVGGPSFSLAGDMAESCDYLIQQKVRGPIHDWICPHLKEEVERRPPPPEVISPPV